MRSTIHRPGVLLAIVLIAFGPLLIGVFTTLSTVLFAGIAILALYSFGRSDSPPWTRKLSLSFLSICLTITAADLITHMVSSYVLEQRPKILFARRLAVLPEVYRFFPKVHFAGQTSGDLAAVSLRSDWREYRDLEFATGNYGFRRSGAL